MTRENTLISIIIPNYNNERYLSQCLENCINQTYKNIEIIIVDDCSTDNSLKLIESYIQKDNRIKLIINETNQKVSKTRDIGIRNSNGEWITTLDSDDFYYSDEKIEKEVDLLSKNNFDKSIIAFSKTIRIDSSGKNILSIMNKDRIKEGDIFDFMISRSCAIPRDFLFSKKLYFEVGGFDFNIPIYEDWDLKLRLSKLASFYLSDSHGTAYRQHNNGLSSAKQTYHHEWILKIFVKNTKNIDYEKVISLRKKLLRNIDPRIIDRIIRKFKYVLGKK